MLTNIKSESNAPFLKSPPLAHKIIFLEKKSTSSSKIGFSIEYSCHTIININPGTPEYRNTYKKTFFVTYL